ncbi:MAG TPA: 50S ribosomal protein L3 N(5)-glutamine methyltransferase [Oceanospirillales bacterium]|nr:50S ribosomal protein L3 N(5)-glutamine methyltransferase [Oceanospirillales bacterium]
MTKEQLFMQLCQQLDRQDLFFGHAVIDGEDEAMMIMMYIFGETVTEILQSGDKIVQPLVVNKAQRLLNKRIISKQPMAYIIGEVKFAGLKFKIDQRALVPRSPIAELILNGFKPWLNLQNVNSALDLCTGSGCIGIALAHYYKHISVDLADISQKALDLASENIEFHQLKSRVKTISSDLFVNIKKTYDLILTNPPYVGNDEYQQLPQEYKNEPKLGLVSDNNGLEIPVKILYDAAKYLNDGGFLFLEVGYSDELLQATFEQVEFNWIDFSQGGCGVCVFSKEKLLEYHDYFKNYLEAS